MMHDYEMMEAMTLGELILYMKETNKPAEPAPVRQRPRFDLSNVTAPPPSHRREELTLRLQRICRARKRSLKERAQAFLKRVSDRITGEWALEYV